MNNIIFDFWACQRPLTKKWGSGQVFARIEKQLGIIDVAFGKTDGIPDSCRAIDHNTGYEWKNLPFEDNHFEFGYWDPPYDKLYKPEGVEIWRIVKRIAILHTYIWPRSWLKDAIREAMIACTFGPMKQIRCLQVFRKGTESTAIRDGEQDSDSIGKLRREGVGLDANYGQGQDNGVQP